MRNNKSLFFILGILFVVISGYILGTGVLKRPTISQPGNENKKLQVNTSFYPLYFFAAKIGGSYAEVKNITPNGVEPHDYDPTTQDMIRIESGDILILNGGIETWSNKIQDNLKGTKVKIIVTGEGLFTKELTEEGEKTRDPHIWLDPRLAKKQISKITEGYIGSDPDNKSYYEKNERDLNLMLDQLDNKFRQGLQNCQSKDLITSHTAFAYLAQTYRLNQVAISGITPDGEPSAQQLTEVADFAKKNNVKYIFFESLVSPKLSETIANEIGAQTSVLDPLEGLSEDDIKQGKNYFTVMEDNLENIRIALQCK